jgi:hypothetical protein
VPNVLQHAERNRLPSIYLLRSRLPHQHFLRTMGAVTLAPKIRAPQIHPWLAPNRLAHLKTQMTKLRVVGSAALLCEDGSLPYFFLSSRFVGVRFRSLRLMASIERWRAHCRFVLKKTITCPMFYVVCTPVLLSRIFATCITEYSASCLRIFTSRIV